jgi:hypothetical protein
MRRYAWLHSFHDFPRGGKPGEKVMLKRKTSISLMIAMVVAPILSMFLGGEPVIAQNNSPEYTFLVASGFLCDSGNCPAGAKSVNGDTYEITGAGTFNAQSKSVNAAGTFTHKIPNGTVVETGVWTSNQLIRFDVYGASPNALRQRGIAAGVPGFRPNLLPMSVSPVPVGGLAVFHIRLLPASGMPMAAVLQVNCALGDAPRERSADGIRLKLERSPSEFSEERGGSVMFLAMPLQPAAPGKGKQQEPGADGTQAPNN